MRWAMLWLVLLGMGLGVVPLEEGRARQLATYEDGAHPDQPALYALLADVAEWPAEAALEGVAEVDWTDVLANPEAYRGEAVWVEGRDAGRRRRIGLMRRQRPWGEAVTEWGVVGSGRIGQADRPATDVGDRPVVVVWFLDPSGDVGPAVLGRRMRVAGRFLGLWEDVDGKGEARVYPVVVGWAGGRVAEAGESQKVGGLGLGGGMVWGMGWALMGLGVVWWWCRAWARVGRVRSGRGGRVRAVRFEAGLEADLPAEPGEALAALAERRARGR